MTDRAEILTTAASLIGGERQQDYGTPAENFARIGNLWAEVFGHPVSPVEVALCMGLVKVARLINSPDHLDSWVDGAGYLALGGEIATTFSAAAHWTDVVVPRVVERLTPAHSASEWTSRLGHRYRWNPSGLDNHFEYPWDRIGDDGWSQCWRGDESVGPYTEVIK